VGMASRKKVKPTQPRRAAGRIPIDGAAGEPAVLGKLLEAARELFLSRGVNAVTVRSIAQKAGCSVGLPYHYVDSKEDLLARLLAGTFTRLLDRLRRQAKSHQAPLERLGAVLAAYVQFGLEHPHDYALLFAAGPGEVHEHLCRVFHTLGIECYGVIRDCCAECICTGEFREDLQDAEAAAQALWAGAHGLVHLLGAAEGFPFRPRKALLRCHVETLVAGVRRPRPGA
jgi:AcrR family transcriptional regulator